MAEPAGEKSDDGPNRIMVFLRIRPAKKGEINEAEGQTYLMDVQPNNKDILLEGGKSYNFDYVFNGTAVHNLDIYDRVGQPVIDNVFKGFWGTLLVYGQTGTGKSFTMMNFDAGNEGIVARAMQSTFEKIVADTDRVYTVKMSFLQIYLDKLQDLFNPSKKEEQKLTRDEKGVHFPGIVEQTVNDYEHFKQLYDDGNQYRVITATKMNPESSRGHAALFMQISSVPRDDPSGEVRSGKLFMIDLAGYERFSKTGVQEGIMKEEAKTINASLLSLGNVVSALSQKSEHVPWRNAKLTRMLEDAIGGKAKCSIILTAGPSSDHHHETIGTLYFGSRAMDVKTTAERVINVDWKKLAAKLQGMLTQAEGKINQLEVDAVKRQLEREEAEARMQSESAAVQKRHEDQLQDLLQGGASPEKIQELIQANKAEAELLEEQHYTERNAIETRQEEEIKESMEAKSRADNAEREALQDGVSHDIAQLQRQLVAEREEKERYKTSAKEAETEARRVLGELNEARVQLTSNGLDIPSSAGGSSGDAAGKGGSVSSTEMRREMERRIQSVRQMLEETHTLKLQEVEEPLREEVDRYKKLYDDLRATADDELQAQKDALTTMYDREIEQQRQVSAEVQEKLKKNHLTIKKSYQAQREQLQEENMQLMQENARLQESGGGGSGPANAPRPSGVPTVAEVMIMKKQSERRVEELQQAVTDLKADVDYVTTEKEALERQLREYAPQEGEDRIKPAAVRRLKADFDELANAKKTLETELFKLKAAQALSGPQKVDEDDETSGELDHKEDMCGDFSGLPTFCEKMLKFPYYNGAKPIKSTHEHILSTLTTDLDEYRRTMRVRVIFVGAQGSGKSSVVRCMTSNVPLLKSAPEVSPTLHPGVQSGHIDDPSSRRLDLHRQYVKFEDVAEMDPKRSGSVFGSILGSDKSAESAKVYFDLVDLPSAGGFWRATPSQFLPSKCVCYVITYNLTQPLSSIKEDVGAQLGQIHASVHRDYGSVYGGDAPRVGVCLVGTHRDAMRDQKEASVCAQLNKITVGLGETFFKLRGDDTYGMCIIGNYAVSCSEWTVISSKGNKGAHSFRDLFSSIVLTANKLADAMPSGFLPSSKDSASHTSYVLGDDNLQGPVERTSKLDSTDRRLRKGIVTLLSAIHRESKVRWIMSDTDFRTMVAEHLGVEEAGSAGSQIINFVVRELGSRGVLLLLPTQIYEPKYLPHQDDSDRDPLPRAGLVCLDFNRLLMLYSTFMTPITLTKLPAEHPALRDRNAILCDPQVLNKIGNYAHGFLPQQLVQGTCSRLLSMTSSDVKLLCEVLCVMGLGLGIKTEPALLSPAHFTMPMTVPQTDYTSYLVSNFGDGVGRKYTLNTIPQAFFARLQLMLVPFSHVPTRDAQHAQFNWCDASLLVLEKSRLKWGIFGSQVIKDAVMALAAPVRGMVKVEGNSIYVVVTSRGPSAEATQCSTKILNAIHHQITVLCRREFRGVSAAFQELSICGVESKRQRLREGIATILGAFDVSEDDIAQQQGIVGSMADPKGQEIEQALSALPDHCKRD